MICAFLSKYEKHVFGFYERPWDALDKGFDHLLKVKDYEWNVEVPFGLMYGKYLRFDILGRSRAELQLTDRYPFVAIEIVDTHFHSQSAFAALLEATRNLPLVVAYCFVQVTPRYNCVNKPVKSNSYSRVRLQCYMADGSFWVRNERMEELHEVSPQEPTVYYNLIRERLYADGFIRSSALSACKT